MSTKPRNEPIAVIGMACRFPGGANIAAFWEFLARGGDAVGEIPADRWNAAEYYDPDPGAVGKMYTKYGAFLPGFDYFSPSFFGISPREAQFMDPQQRLLLEVSWEALENAAVVPGHLSEQQVGIFVGIGTSDYGDLQVPFGPPGVDAYNGTGGSHAAAAGRLSYVLGVRGPSLAVDTACSSSLVSVHLAMMSLRAGESDLALASGVNLNFAPDIFISLCKARMLSPDGRCKTFDASANGYVRGEGCGVVVLKRLSDALADGDHIHALLRGSAVNHNGRSSGLTVPSGPAQQEVIRTALRNAGVEPSEVGYLEAHGTGTPVGDPIEAAAISAVFANQPSPLLIGSVKTNCGHLEWAAGVCGLIKVILSMRHDLIPASLHLKEPNPMIKWDRVPFRVVTEATPWPDGHKMAGVSSFGFGGTNAHVIVEEAPRVIAAPAANDRALHLFTLSAKSENSLQDLAVRFADEAERSSPETLANICFTANTGRAHFEHRLTALVASGADLARDLRDFADGRPNAGTRSARVAEPVGMLAMLFTGQGSQLPGMGRELYDTQPTFREAIDCCAGILQPLMDRPLLEILYPRGVTPDDATAPIHDTACTQPALFATEYALAMLWRSWGVEPEIVMGHSVGEYVAACVAGVFDLPEGLRLIAARGRLMQALPRDGAMLAVRAAEDLVAPLLVPYRDRVSIAAINGPRDVVISGAADAVDAIAAELTAAGVHTRRLVVSHAFHSPLMEPMLEAFRRVAETVTFRPPGLTLISNVTGGLAGEEVASADYWVRHVHDAVRFADGIRTALAEGCSRFLEAGPQPVLCAMGRATLGEETLSWLPSLQAKRGDWHQMLDSLAALHLLGCAIDWRGFDRDYPRAKLPLPTYPFERQRFWFPLLSGGGSKPGAALSPLVDSIARSPLVKETILSVALGVTSHPYLADHVVFGQPIVPGAAYLAILASGADLLGWPSCRLSNVFFLAPLPLPDGKARPMQAVLSPDEAGGFRFDIVVVSEQEGETLRLASGTIAPLAVPAPSRIDLEELRRRCAKGLDPDRLYDAAGAAGVELGPRFRWVEQVWTGEREALGALRAPEAIGDIAGQAIHPVLLDSCFQIAGATLMDDAKAESLLPFSIESMTVHRAATGTNWWCHAVRKGEATWDLSLFDVSGAVIATLKGFEMRKAASDRFFRRRMADWLYRPVWHAQALAPVAAISGTWLVMGGGEVARAVSRGLAAQGCLYIVVSSGGAFDGGAISNGRAVIRAKEPAEIVRLLEQCEALGLPPCAGAIDLRGYERPLGDESIVEQSQDLAIGLLHLAQALKPPARLLVVTRLAQPVRSGDDPDPAQAALWGMIRTLMLEAPHLIAGGLDLDPMPAERQAEAILAELTGPANERQAAIRNNERLVARLVRDRDAIAAPIEGPYRLRLSDYGSPDHLHLAPMTPRAPGPTEVQIAVRAAALNFRDVLISLGMLRAFYETELGIAAASDIQLGFDCAGVITAVGERVGDLAVGDAVMAAAAGGSASHVTIFRECVTRLPDGMDFATASAIPNVFLTAWHALVTLAKLGRGDRVLIHAAAGGVGLAAVQIARDAGAEVFATASPAKWAYLRTLGVVHIMNSRTLDFADEILAATGGAGVDVVLNSLNGVAVDKSFAALKQGGRFVELGKLGIWTKAEAAARRPDAAWLAFELGAAMDAEPALFQSYGETIKSKLEAGVFQALPTTEFPIAEAVEAYRFMQQARHVGKVVLTLDATARTEIVPHASYLITGGLGGLGLKVAARLVKAGAREIVLAGRRDLGEAAIEAMRRDGATVTIVRSDVANPADVAAMIAACQARGELKGIVHAAGVIRDATLRNQDAARFTSVMAPKAAGAWLLHQSSRDLDLDFFVCFSSMASLVGSAGQTNYSAANAFMDGLVHHRRANSLPALSINWGPWADVGMAAELDLSRSDVEKLDVDGGLDMFMALLRPRGPSAPVQTGVFRMRWNSFLGRWPDGEAPACFASLATARSREAPARSGFIETFHTAPAEARESLLIKHIHEVLRQVLVLDPGEAIVDDLPWADFGLDSLMMVEVKNLLERSLQVALPVEILMQDVSVRSLVAFLIERIADAPVAEPVAAAPENPVEEDGVRLEILDRLRGIPQMFTSVDAQERRKVLIGGRWRIDFASCNYLGFDLEPEIMAAVPPAFEAWGVHPSWTRAVASPRLYADLERELADLVGAAHTLVFPSISLLHLGVLPALAGGNGIILKDVEAHHSIHEACQRARGDGVEWVEFRHNDLEDLERRLSKIRADRTKIIATDGAYSMGSPNPPLMEYARLARTYNASVYVDDAHGFGIFGANPDDALPYGYGGDGIVRQMGLDYERDRIIYVAGLSKAFSSYAAFVTCRDEQIKELLQTSGPYIFSGPTSVASLATALAGLRLNRRDGDTRRARIHRLTRRLVAEARRIGFEVDNDSDFPIVGVVIGGWEAMTAACDILWRNDILITPATFPAVPMNRNLVRFSITSANTEEELDQAIRALHSVWDALHTGAAPKREFVAAR